MLTPPPTVTRCRSIEDRAVARGPRPFPRHADGEARRYLAWLQDWGLDGDRRWSGPSGLLALYGDWYCVDQWVRPLPDNVLGAALGRIVRVRQVSDYSSGVRRRWSVYAIPPGPEDDEDARERLVA